MNIYLGILSENMTPSTELPRDFCAGIGPLQLGVVLVVFLFTSDILMMIEKLINFKE